MFSAASLAPPCKGPHKEVKPVDIDANGFTPDDAANLTVDVDAFCSWSACKINILSNALANTLFTLYFSAGTQKPSVENFLYNQVCCRDI